MVGILEFLVDFTMTMVENLLLISEEKYQDKIIFEMDNLNILLHVTDAVSFFLFNFETIYNPCKNQFTELLKA